MEVRLRNVFKLRGLLLLEPAVGITGADVILCVALGLGASEVLALAGAVGFETAKSLLLTGDSALTSSIDGVDDGKAESEGYLMAMEGLSSAKESSEISTPGKFSKADAAGGPVDMSLGSSRERRAVLATRLSASCENRCSCAGCFWKGDSKLQKQLTPKTTSYALKASLGRADCWIGKLCPEANATYL